MNRLEKTKNKIDLIINKESITLKANAIKKFFSKVQSLNNVEKDDFQIEIYLRENSVRKDLAYNPEDSYESAFYANIFTNNMKKTINVKNIFKDLIHFSLEYKPTLFYFDYGISYNDKKKYNSNEFLNSLVKSIFTDKELNIINVDKNEAGKTIFENIVKKINDNEKYTWIDFNNNKNLDQNKIQEIIKNEQSLLNSILEKKFEKNIYKI